MNFLIRGENSLNNSNEPLIVIDGVPIENTTISNSEDTWGGRDYGNGVSDINPDDIENILTDDFIGRNEKSRFTWTKENHQNFWTENKGMAQDSIYRQLAQGPWVATMFMRKMNWEGRDIEAEFMHFKRFEGEKIAEIFEFGDSKQRE